MQKMMKKIIILFVLVLIFSFPFKSSAFVTASTGQAISVTTTGATLNGSLTNDQPGIGATGYFQYSQNNTSSCNLMVNPITTGYTTIFNPPAGVNTFPMTTTLTQLQPNTTYYFCAVGFNSAPYPISYGSVSSFHTASLPSGGGSSSNAGSIGTVTTYNAFNITDQEASFDGSVSSTTGTSYAYFRYTTTKVPPVFCNDIYGSDMKSVTASIPNASGQVTSGHFYASVENLEEDTEYYYCAIVSNTSLDPNSNKLWVTPNIKYGQVKSFHTLPCATCPHTTITTEPATSVKSTSAKLNGSYFSTKTVTTYFQYKKASLLANPGSSIDPDGTVTQGNPTQSSWITVGSSQHNVNASTNFNSVYGGVSYNLTGLLPDTLYNFRLVGVTSNPTETFYGNTINFVTHKYEGVGPLGNSGGGGTGGGTTGGGGTTPTTCPTGYTGTPPNCTLTNTNGPLPTISVTANPPTITVAGGTSTITWTSTNTTSCAANIGNGGIGGSGATGSFGTGPITTGHSYGVTCTGPNGSVSDSVYVYVNTGGGNGGTGGGGGGGGGGTTNLYPSASITANPMTIEPGQTTNISWTSSIHLLDACIVSEYPGLSNSQNNGLSGSFNTAPLFASHSYSVSCTGPNGSVSDSVSVHVNTGGGSGGGSGGSGGGSGGSGGGSGGSGGGSGGSGGGSGGSGGGSGGSGGGSGGSGGGSGGSGGGSGGSGGGSGGSGGGSGGSGGGGTNSNTNLSPSVSIIANPMVIAPGASSTVSWQSTTDLLDSCIVSGYSGLSNSQNAGLTGSFSTGPLSASHSYSITCTGPNGSVGDSVIVYVNNNDNQNGNTNGSNLPSVFMTGSPILVPENGTATISWTSTNTTSCNSGGNGNGTSGSFNTGTLAGSRSYSVTCSGVNGSASDSVFILVNQIYEYPGDDGNPGDDTSTPPFVPTCPVGWTGTPTTGCTDPTSNNFCPIGWSGAWPTCTGPTGGGTGLNTSCPTGWTGTYPSCTGPTTPGVIDACSDLGSGWTGTYPVCSGPSTGGGSGGTGLNTSCPFGWTGVYPSCTGPTTPGVIDACSDLGSGWTGTYPVCSGPSTGGGSGGTGLNTSCPTGWTGTYPTCTDTGNNNVCPTGWTGTYPTCTFSNNNNFCLSSVSANLSDIDGDGIVNILDIDTDGDGTPNNVDLDDDSDNIPDLIDFSPTGIGSANDYDSGGIPNVYDSDIDGDEIPNVIDNDTDGDGVLNIADFDDDNDGIPDLIDASPTGIGNNNDYDGGGTSNANDSDIDGDGIPNESDSNTDGDCLPNNIDQDDDNDGIPDGTDNTPTGINSLTGPILQIGDTAFPAFDDIVRYHEGIEHVFIRRIMKSSIFQNKYGYQTGSNLQIFAWNLAHLFAKDFGYVNSAGREIRVSKPDVSAYSLRLSGNKLTVYEYYKNKIIDIRNTTNQFKSKNPYEYYFKKN
jgi:hypothetical protein